MHVFIGASLETTRVMYLLILLLVLEVGFREDVLLIRLF